MKIDVIIPHWKESELVTLNALTSIDNQVGVTDEVQITIVQDGDGEPLDEKHINKLVRNKINLLYCDQNLGPGGARQYGIDHTDGDYILFCDADDQLATPFALQFFTDIVKQHPELEVVCTGYYEEYEAADGSTKYRCHCNSEAMGGVHGKLFKRSFLKEHNIVFPKIRVSEDTAFVIKCLCYAQKAYFDNEFFTYLWRKRANSLSRQKGSLEKLDPYVRTFRNVVEAFQDIFDEMYKPEVIIKKETLIPGIIQSLRGQMGLIQSMTIFFPDLQEELDIADKLLTQYENKYIKH